MWHLLTVWLLVGISALMVACLWHNVHINLKSPLLYGMAGPILSLSVLVLGACFFYTAWYGGDRSRLLALRLTGDSGFFSRAQRGSQWHNATPWRAPARV